MRYKEEGGAYHIFVETDSGESEKDVLRAIARASFELAAQDEDAPAYPVSLSDQEVDQFIRITEIIGDVVLGMDHWRGRWCITYLTRVEKYHFILSNAFQSLNGIPVAMLERAKLNLELARI